MNASRFAFTQACRSASSRFLSASRRPGEWPSSVGDSVSTNEKPQRKQIQNKSTLKWAGDSSSPSRSNFLIEEEETCVAARSALQAFVNRYFQAVHARMVSSRSDRARHSPPLPRVLKEVNNAAASLEDIDFIWNVATMTNQLGDARTYARREGTIISVCPSRITVQKQRPRQLQANTNFSERRSKPSPSQVVNPNEVCMLLARFKDSM